MGGQDAPDYVFINGDAESQGNLLSDSRAAPGWIALFCADHGIDEFFGGSLWTGLTPALRRKQYVVFLVYESFVEVQQGRGSQYDCRTAQTRRPHEQGAQSCDETIGCPEIRRSLVGSIQDQQLMLDENGFGDHGTEAARAQKPGDRSEDMNEKHDEMAHHSIVARTANAGNYGENWQFAMDLEPALIRKLYELPPPGQREMYMSIFDRYVELRPQVELRGYASKSLWDEYQRLESSSAAPSPGIAR
jgi:hypothetical protein